MATLKDVAEASGLTVGTVSRVLNNRGYISPKTREKVYQVMKELNPDVIVVVAFGQIIPKEILHMPKYGCINVHASLLPAYRGAAPIQWAVINGDKESGVTIMRMDEGVDTGDMINKVIVPLNEKETGGSLFDRLSESGAKLLVETLPMLEDGSAVFEKQPEESTTPYAAMISKKPYSLCRYDHQTDGIDQFREISRGTGKTGARFKSVAKCIFPSERKNFENMGSICGRRKR